MAYTIVAAADPLAIQEREWAAAPRLQFTAFTSCIGVIARVKDRQLVIGIHLALISSESVWVTEQDLQQVPRILRHLDYDEQTVCIVGETKAWVQEEEEENDAKVASPYWGLMAAVEPVFVQSMQSGTLAVEIEERGMKFTYRFLGEEREPQVFYFPQAELRPPREVQPDPLSAATSYPHGYARW